MSSEPSKPLPPLYLRRKIDPTASPFSGDLFDRERVAKRLTAHIARLPHGAVISIDAAWGEGKTWFAQNWIKALKREGYRAVYIDAFKNDYVDDPFVMICAEILAGLKTEGETQEKVRRTGKRVAKALLPLTAKVVTNAVGRIALGSADLGDELKKSLEELQAGSAEALEAALEDRLSKYVEDKKAIDEFQHELTRLVEQDSKPVVIFIDELDRCRPDFAVNMIEQIKHFFEVDRLVFVLFMNRGQLCEAVKGVYGRGIDADSYLGKFIQFSLALPKRVPTPSSSANDNEAFLGNLLAQYGLENRNSEAFASMMAELGAHFAFSLRDMECAAVLYSLAQPVNSSAAFLSWPIALKLKRPSLFQKLLQGDTKAHKEAHDLAGGLAGEFSQKSFIQAVIAIHALHFSGGKMPVPEEVNRVLLAVYSGTMTAERFFPTLFARVDLAVNV